MSLTLDVSSMRRAVNFSIYQVGRDGADVLNRAGRNVAIKAIQKTPKASLAKIRAVPDSKIAAFLLAKARKSGKRYTKSELKAAVAKEKKRRASSIAYTKGPGWHKAAVAFGGRGVRTQAGFERSEARRGRGKKAKPITLVAELVNTAPAIEKIGVPALQESLDDAAMDLVVYGEKKLMQLGRKAWA